MAAATPMLGLGALFRYGRFAHVAWRGVFVKLSRVVAGLAVVATLFGGCGGGSDDTSGGGSGDAASTTVGAAAAAEVSIKGLAFDPSAVSIKAGESVTWSFDDGDIPHGLSFAGFKSDTMSKGTFSRTFADAGTFDYTCTVHPTMKGSVTVA